LRVPIIPDRPEEIDAAWLTEAFQRRHPGAEVISVEVVERHEATNAHARLRVGYAKAAGAPETLFFKLLPGTPGRRDAIRATGMGIREARFYAELAPSVRLRVPRVHCVALEPEGGAFAIGMEDLPSSGCRVPDGAAGVPVDSAARALEELAAMHRRYRDAGRRAVEAPWVAEPGPPSEYGTSRLRFALDHHRDRLTEPFAEIAELYVRACVPMHALWHRGPHTLIHGDTHVGNLFLDGARIGFLDWGLVALTTPLRDVSYFLAMALSIADRRREERALLAHWVDCWNAGGGASIGFDEAWLAHRVQAAYTVPACCQIVTFPAGISEERRIFSEAFLARAEAALEDLEVRDALRRCGIS